MFWHVFKYRLKCLLRDRITLFWTLIFPLVLGTLFHFTFGHLTSDAEGFEAIKTAVIDDESYRGNTPFQEVLQALAEPGRDQFLDLVIVPEEEAERLLDEGSVVGVIRVGEDMELMVRQRVIRQSILKSFLDTYSQTMNTAQAIAVENPAASFEPRLSFTEEISFSGAKPDTNLGYFYALIAMTCVYGSYWGIRNTMHLQADQSPQGARRSIAPTRKTRIVLSDTLAALVITLGEVSLLLTYVHFAFGISFGDQLGLILLTSLVGSASGVALGNVVGTSVRGDENLKYVVLLIANLTLSFLAGLMWAPMKDMVSQRFPLLGYLNPAALIADCFYSLHIYSTLQRFWINIGVLCLITVVLSLVSAIHLRRERYASL